MTNTTEIQPTTITADVFIHAGLANLPVERREDLMEQMMELVSKRMMLAVIERVPESERTVLHAAETINDAAVQQLIQQYMPDFVEVLDTEIQRVGQELLSVTDEVRNA